MGCEACRTTIMQDMQYISYRWKDAGVVIVACAVHGLEIIEALNKAQEEIKQ